jgi:hypothetical protein
MSKEKERNREKVIRIKFLIVVSVAPSQELHRFFTDYSGHACSAAPEKVKLIVSMCALRLLEKAQNKSNCLLFGFIITQ